MQMDSSFLAANSPKATLFAKWLTGFLSQISPPPFFLQPAILLEIGQLEINNARLCYFT